MSDSTVQTVVADAPQVAYEHKGGLEYDQAALEVDYNSHKHQHLPPFYDDQGQAYEDNRHPRLIFGLRKAVWMIAIIAILVIGGAIGAGVGAGLAAQNKK